MTIHRHDHFLRRNMEFVRRCIDDALVGLMRHEPVDRFRRGAGRVEGIDTGLFRELLTYMMEDPRVITPCTHLLFMAKNLERVGDHATNIAENIWFQEYGEGPTTPREKRDETSSTG